jgi:AcrR family transcriptional regulator
MTPRHARSDQVVNDIVAAARQRFGVSGYEATSIDEIAADAGRTKGAVYHHFADKRDLFQRAFVAEQRQIASIVARAADLPRGVAAYLRTIANAPGSARITLIDGPVVLGWATWRSCDDGPFRSMVRASLATYEGLDERHDLEVLTELLLGAITEAAEHVATSPRPRPAAKRYASELEHMIDAVVGGVRPSTATAPG